MANVVKKKEWDDREMALKPFMNLMVVLIPILLLSTEFAKMAIVDIKLPKKPGCPNLQKEKKALKEDESNKLLLTAIITDSAVTLGAKSGFLPSIFYQEWHHYIAKDDQADFTVKFDPSSEVAPKHPKTGRPMEIYERYDIYLYACDETHTNLKQCMYSKFGEMMTDVNNQPATKANIGDTLYTLTVPRKMVIVTNPDDYKLKSLFVCDELKNRLMQVKERWKDADDAEDIIISAENEVMYDKIIQIMDAARTADFPNISIAKLRS